MDAQTIHSLRNQIQSQPPAPSPGTHAHATLHRSPSASNSLELKLYIPMSAASSPESEPMPIIIAYPVPGPQSHPTAVPMEVRDSAITLESVPPPADALEEKRVNDLFDGNVKVDPDEGFDIVDVNELDGWEVCPNLYHNMDKKVDFEWIGEQTQNTTCTKPTDKSEEATFDACKWNCTRTFDLFWVP